MAVKGKKEKIVDLDGDGGKKEDKNAFLIGGLGEVPKEFKTKAAAKNMLKIIDKWFHM